MPLEWLIAVLRDPKAEQSRRDRAAEVCLPFLHPRLAAIEVARRNRSAVAGDNLNTMQVLSVPRGCRIVDGVVIDGTELAPYTPTPALTDQTVASDPKPPEPLLEVLEVVDDGKVEPLDRWRRKPDPDLSAFRSGRCAAGQPGSGRKGRGVACLARAADAPRARGLVHRGPERGAHPYRLSEPGIGGVRAQACCPDGQFLAATAMTNICNTLLALAAAAMVFGFAITWKPEINIVIVLALILGCVGLPAITRWRSLC